MKQKSKPLPGLELKGQGVFAGQAIKEGEVLECSPLIPVPAAEWKYVSRTVLRYYCYICRDSLAEAVLALGFGSLFKNSPQHANAYYVIDHTERFMEFFAARNIEQGEEITVNRRQLRQAGQISTMPENKNLYAGSSPGKGRGVFAGRPIAGGELIEKVTLLLIPAGEWSYIEHTVLSNYWFSFGPNKEHAAIAMGYGSLYNHSYQPSALYEVKDWEMGIQFKALQDIQEGEEIMVNYNRDPRDRSPVWFDVLP